MPVPIQSEQLHIKGYDLTACCIRSHSHQKLKSAAMHYAPAVITVHLRTLITRNNMRQKSESLVKSLLVYDFYDN